MKRFLLIFSAVWMFVIQISAQSGGTFQITKSVIAGGGGRTSGGTFTLDATIGEPVAGTNSTGGNFSVISGFRGGGGGLIVVPRRTLFDFDGDGKTDIAIFRPAPAEWWYQRSGSGQILPRSSVNLRTSSRPPILPATAKPTSLSFVLRRVNGLSSEAKTSTFFAFPFGSNGDIPCPADFDGDGKTDPAVFRPSSATWFVLRSGDGGVTIQQFGNSNDLPIPADFDGDGKADIAIYRRNGASGAEWWSLQSTAGLFAIGFGAATDKAVVGDYTGDGRADVAFWRPSSGQWFILRSEDLSFFAFPFGANGDIPAPGDYDGDGKTDAAVFRPASATWFIQASTAGVIIQQFGLSADVPVPNAFVR